MIFEDLAKQTTEAAKQVCGREYGAKQVLFADFRGKTVVFINTSFVRFCLRGIR